MISVHCVTDWPYAVARLVEALPCKPEGCGFDSLLCHWNSSLTSFFLPHYELDLLRHSLRSYVEIGTDV